MRSRFRDGEQVDVMGESVTGPSRRARAEGGRSRSVRVSFSDMELGKVRSAALRAGMSDAAWLGEVGVRAAEPPQPAPVLGPVIQRLMVLHAELMDGRRILRSVGGNLSGVARHANSTGEVHEETRRIEALVERVVQRLDETVSSIGELMALARERARSQP